MYMVFADFVQYHAQKLHQRLFIVEEGISPWQVPGIRLVAGVLVSLLCASVFYWWGQNYDKESPGKYFDANRDYTQIPFGMLDATDICAAKTSKRFSEQLVMSYVDYHSTHWEADKNLYKVFMLAHVGNPQIYSEVSVHCFVDPTHYMVDHYRTFAPKRDSLMSRAVKLFTT
jgi:hypothetical protein